MGFLGYNSELGVGAQTAQTAMNMCWLVCGLYLFSALLMFVGLAVVYNLDKKTVAKMREELDARMAQDGEVVAESEQAQNETSTVAEDIAQVESTEDNSEE